MFALAAKQAQAATLFAKGTFSVGSSQGFELLRQSRRSLLAVQEPPRDLCLSPGEVSKHEPQFITQTMICVLAVCNMGQDAEETWVGRTALPKGETRKNTNFRKAASPSGRS